MKKGLSTILFIVPFILLLTINLTHALVVPSTIPHSTIKSFGTCPFIITGNFFGKNKIHNSSNDKSIYKRFIHSSVTCFNSKNEVEAAEVEINNKSNKQLDKLILQTLVPSIINLMVVPLVNSVDTFWVGRMGDALALAGQAAANQAFFSLFFLIAFLPTITAPLVATAMGAKDQDAASERISEALFLSNLFGLIGTIMLVAFPRIPLSLVLSQDAPALTYAVPYLRLRGLSMIPALVSATGFAAYRGLLNTVTPLKVSLFANALNVVADPIAIFGFGVVKGIGVGGAALATAFAELSSGLIYIKLLMKRKLLKLRRLVKPPKWRSLVPLLQGGLAMLVRQIILNISFIGGSRRAQTMDPTGVAAAAYSIVMQIYSLGIVVQLAVQSTAATLIPSAKASDGDEGARATADRIFKWGIGIGSFQAIAQLLVVPFLIPLFSPIPEVQNAARVPALITSLVHFQNGFVFPGEGYLLGLGLFKALATITGIGVACMIGCLASPIGKSIDGIIISIAAFHMFQAVAVVYHYLKIGPLKRINDMERDI